MNRPSSRHLCFEQLETRLTLDGQGAIAGLDPHLTLSFAADGVTIAGQANALNGTFDAVAATSVWREQILRAFQTWAVHTNADIGVVSDGGQPFGTPGASQRDHRFGDIRVGAIATAPEVGAVSIPVTNIVSGTWLADVIFNTSFAYQTADDILAVAMHEAGNVFGLPDNADPNSPLFTGGQPVVHPPTSADIAALQSLHGVRAPDANESHENDVGQFTDNDSVLTATKIKLVDAFGGNEGTAPSIVYGDISGMNDIDVFVIETPGDYTGAVTISLRSAGISLLQPDLTVLSASGQTLAHSVSQTVGGAALEVAIPAATPHQVLYVRIAGAAADVFGVGGYSLVAAFDGIDTVDQATVDSLAGGAYRFLTQAELAKFFDDSEGEFFNDDGHTDDDADFGVELDTAPGFVDGTRYEAIGSIADASDIDYYTLKSPQLNGPSSGVLTISVRALETAGLLPKILVLDEDQQPLTTEIVVNGGGEAIVQVLNVAADTDYLIGVKAAQPNGPFGSGNYSLEAVFHSSPVELQSLAQGTLGGAAHGNVHTLHIGRPQLFHFVLGVLPAATTTPTAVLVAIRDENSTAIAQFASPLGERRSPPAVFLQPGSYTVTFTALTLDGSPPPLLSYQLIGTSVSDPFVGDPEGTGSHPFACPDPNIEGHFCYPGGITSSDPYLWDSFVGTLPAAPPPLELTQLIDFLLGDWWSWVWMQSGANGPPLARDDTFVTVQSNGVGAALSGTLGPSSNVLANDLDPENDAVVAVLSSPALNGYVTLRADGTFDYLPAPGFFGTDRFTYIANDFLQSSADATVRIVVGSGMAGDYNADGAIDADDLMTWRADFGSSSELRADGNRDGFVDAADYLIWRDAMHVASAGSAAAVGTIKTELPLPLNAAGDADSLPVFVMGDVQRHRQLAIALPALNVPFSTPLCGKVATSTMTKHVRTSALLAVGAARPSFESLPTLWEAGSINGRKLDLNRRELADLVFENWPHDEESVLAGPQLESLRARVAVADARQFHSRAR